MQLNVTYDAITLATAPSGFFSAVNYVVALFDATFTNSATVNIEIGYGDFPLDGSPLFSFLGLNEQNNIVPVTVQSSPPGLSFIVDGATYTDQHVFQWVIGSGHRLDADP